MYRIFKHKKAIGIDHVVPFIFFIGFVLVILILSVNNTKKKKEMKIDVELTLDYIKAQQKLLDFLEKKIEVNEKTVTTADLISSYYYEKKYEAILFKEIEDLLDSLPKPAPASGWNLNIYIMPDDEKIIAVEPYRVIGFFKKGNILTYIPLVNNPGKYLKLKLWLECQC